MDNKIKFINSKHMDNYLDLLKRFPENKGYDFEVALKMLSMEEVYYITKDYIDEIGIKFRELLKDPRVTKNILFICELAYSFFIKLFIVKSLSSTRKLNSDTRNFIINLLYVYNPKENQTGRF